MPANTILKNDSDPMNTLVVSAGETLCGRLLLFDGNANGFQTIKLTKDPECPVCFKK